VLLLVVSSVSFALTLDAVLGGHLHRLVRAAKLVRHERRRAEVLRRHADHLERMTAKYIEIGRLDLAASCQRGLSTW
jgi:hypothetical protein